MTADGVGARPIWRFGPFELNADAFELTRAGERVNIEPQSLRLLEYLIQERARVVSRDDLITTIWQGRAISDWAIAGAIKSLRAALGDTGRQKRLIATVHSRGFRFIAELEVVEPARTTLAVEPETILVRVFRSGAEDPAERYLAEGLTEDLITDLFRHGVPGVLSYHTSRALAESEPPAQLRVARIVDGRVQRLGEAIRVNISVRADGDARPIWAERFDLTRASLFAAQSRIGVRIAEILAPASPVVAARRPPTLDGQAYDRYLKGRYAYFRYEPAAFIEALGHFTAASDIDPNFADALAQQAYCRTTLHVFGLPGADPTLDAAENLARKAIGIDDSSALAFARLGWVLGYRSQPVEAIAAFDAALARDPENEEVYLAFGETLNRLAQPERARGLLERAFARDSYFPPSWQFALGHNHVLAGEHASAIELFLAVLARVERFIPARVQLARAYQEIGEQERAVQAVATIREFAPKYSLAHARRMFPYPIPEQAARLNDALAAAGMR